MSQEDSKEALPQDDRAGAEPAPAAEQVPAEADGQPESPPAAEAAGLEADSEAAAGDSPPMESGDQGEEAPEPHPRPVDAATEEQPAGEAQEAEAAAEAPEASASEPEAPEEEQEAEAAAEPDSAPAAAPEAATEAAEAATPEAAAAAPELPAVEVPATAPPAPASTPPAQAWGPATEEYVVDPVRKLKAVEELKRAILEAKASAPKRPETEGLLLLCLCARKLAKQQPEFEELPLVLQRVGESRLVPLLGIKRRRPPAAPRAGNADAKAGAPMQKSAGRVKSYNTRKGFGFIDMPGYPRDIFVYNSHLIGRVGLIAGEMVEFELVLDGGRPQARQVKVVTTMNCKNTPLGQANNPLNAMKQAMAGVNASSGQSRQELLAMAAAAAEVPTTVPQSNPPLSRLQQPRLQQEHVKTPEEIIYEKIREAQSVAASGKRRQTATDTPKIDGGKGADMAGGEATFGDEGAIPKTSTVRIVNFPMAEVNECIGTIQGYDAASNRYKVSVALQKASGHMGEEGSVKVMQLREEYLIVEQLPPGAVARSPNALGAGSGGGGSQAAPQQSLPPATPQSDALRKSASEALKRFNMSPAAHMPPPQMGQWMGGMGAPAPSVPMGGAGDGGKGFGKGGYGPGAVQQPQGGPGQLPMPGMLPGQMPLEASNRTPSFPVGGAVPPPQRPQPGQGQPLGMAQEAARPSMPAGGAGPPSAASHAGAPVQRGPPAPAAGAGSRQFLSLEHSVPGLGETLERGRGQSPQRTEAASRHPGTPLEHWARMPGMTGPAATPGVGSSTGVRPPVPSATGSRAAPPAAGTFPGQQPSNPASVPAPPSAAVPWPSPQPMPMRPPGAQAVPQPPLAPQHAMQQQQQQQQLLQQQQQRQQQQQQQQLPVQMPPQPQVPPQPRLQQPAQPPPQPQPQPQSQPQPQPRPQRRRQSAPEGFIGQRWRVQKSADFFDVIVREMEEVSSKEVRRILPGEVCVQRGQTVELQNGLVRMPVEPSGWVTVHARHIGGPTFISEDNEAPMPARRPAAGSTSPPLPSRPEQAPEMCQGIPEPALLSSSLGPTYQIRTIVRVREMLKKSNQLVVRNAPTAGMRMLHVPTNERHYHRDRRDRMRDEDDERPPRAMPPMPPEPNLLSTGSLRMRSPNTDLRPAPADSVPSPAPHLLQPSTPERAGGLATPPPPFSSGGLPFTRSVPLPQQPQPHTQLQPQYQQEQRPTGEERKKDCPTQ